MSSNANSRFEERCVRGQNASVRGRLKKGSHDHSSKWVFKEKFLLSYWHVTLIPSSLFLTETFCFQLQSNDWHRLFSLGKIQQAKRFYI